MRRTTLSSNDAALTESIAEELEVGLLEEGLGRALGIRGVGNDNIKGVLVLLKELEAITNVNLDLGVLEAS